MKRDPRAVVMSEARLEFTKLFIALEEKFDLSYGEMFLLLSEKMGRVAEDLVKAERKKEMANGA